jgi:transposase
MDVPAIAKIAFTSEDKVREVIHNFNTDGFESLAPKYSGGRPPKFTLPERQEIRKNALSRPLDHHLPFSTWSTRRYTPTEREQAVRLVRQLGRELGTDQGVVARVARQLGYGVESVRSWVKQANIDDGDRPGTTTADAERIKALEQENRELRRFNEMAGSTGGRNEFCELF